MSQAAHNNARTAGSSHLWAICGVLIVAVIFGGGGSRYGLANLLVQLAALGAFAFHRQAFVQFWSQGSTALRGLVALTVLVPSLFLIPLPPQIWAALPGRELVVQAFELAGGAGWAAASVDPVRTLLAITALITPIAILIIGSAARRDHLITLGWIVVLAGLANMLIGIVQVLSNGETGLFYPENPMPGILFGTFANRNTAGLFLVGCLAFAALLPAPPQLKQTALPLRILICITLLVAVLLTRSRTALVLAMLPVAALCVRLIGEQMSAARAGSTRGVAAPSGKKGWAIAGAVFLTLGAVASIGLVAPGRVGEVMERFQSDRTDARTYIWEDASYAATRYWPVGAGIGTFDDVFQADESLENITQRRAGRAHNDYIEITIEAGALGLALVAGWLVLLVWLSWRARVHKDKWIAWSGAITLWAIALQSITDYPLRNQTLLALAGFALVILIRFSSPKRAAKQ